MRNLLRWKSRHVAWIKGVGLQKLSEHLGLSMEDVIVVGDSDNDIGALKVAGLAVAMGNAKSGIKRLADVQVVDCEHDGCAEAIYKVSFSGINIRTQMQG